MGVQYTSYSNTYDVRDCAKLHNYKTKTAAVLQNYNRLSISKV